MLLQLELFFQLVAAAPASLLMLDYDGTLAPFTTRRDHAFPYPSVRDELQQIMLASRTRVVIISGRDVHQTAGLLNLNPCPEIWGLHGIQRRQPEGSAILCTPPQSAVDALADAERWLECQQLRRAAEFKPASIAFHWRDYHSRRAEELRGRVLLGWRPIAESSGLDLLEFDGGIEICSPEADKGKAVSFLLQEMPPGAASAYLGDDSTDERAFQAIQGRGLSVLVRPKWRHTAAQLWLKPPNELLHFLAKWLHATSQRQSSGLTARAAVDP